MMEYDFTNESFLMNEMHMTENIHSYPIYQQEHRYDSTESNSMITTNDLCQSSLSNSNANYQSYYFPSSIDFNTSNQYDNADNYHFNYQSTMDMPSSHLIDTYSNMLSTNYTLDPYLTQTTSTGSMYIHGNDTSVSTPSVNYQQTTSLWDLGEMNTSSQNITSTSNPNKQPCLVCHEQSSGYHFGAYTCESCKVFYRRVTKDPNIEIKHSCEVPLPNITKSNRKDCRACRKAKCDRVGMTIVSKDRISRTKTTSKSSSMSINNLLEQLSYDLSYNQLSTSSALENLLHLLDLPSLISFDFDYHSLYMNAVQIWRNQYNQFSQFYNNVSFNDKFAVLLFLFYSFMIMKESNETQLKQNIKLDKLVHVLQQEINLITGEDHRTACRIKALFMKCYVALAQYCPNSMNSFDSNYNPQIKSTQQYANYNQ